MKPGKAIIQLGKQGLTENFFHTLSNNFKNHMNVKIVILRSAGHGREQVKEFKDKILQKLGDKYTAGVIGFCIFLKKWRKAMRG